MWYLKYSHLVLYKIVKEKTNLRIKKNWYLMYVSLVQILLADDKELTQWVPLKKLVKYRPENVEKSEVNTYRQKAADERLKRKILPSLFKDLPE